MAENPPHQQIKPAYSESDADVRSLDSTYLSLCVRFAQSHGIYPASSALHPDTSMVYDEPCSLPHPRNQDTGSVSDHQDPITGGLSRHYPNPYTSNVFADTCYPQHDRDHDSYSSSYMETTAPDLTYAQHNSNPFISNDDDMNIDSNLSPDLRNDPQHQASNPFASDTTAPSLSENPHSALQPTQFPKKILQPRHLSSTSEIGDKGLAVLHNYDPLWVQNTGADRSSVFEFSSKMKFEELFRGGVIRKGDKLVIAYTRAFSGVYDKEVATLTVRDPPTLPSPGAPLHNLDLPLLTIVVSANSTSASPNPSTPKRTARTVFSPT